MDKQLTDRIVEAYRLYLGEKLISIILFGSQARGEAKKVSDYDLFIIANELPKAHLERNRFIHRPMYESDLGSLSIIGKTPEEFSKDLSPLYLDLSIDGIILYDTGFAREYLQKIKQIVKSAGLKRIRDNGEYHWEWSRYPKGEWELTWGGFREL